MFILLFTYNLRCLSVFAPPPTHMSTFCHKPSLKETKPNVSVVRIRRKEDGLILPEAKVRPGRVGFP